ncbi:MAG: carbamoyl phosphate synthase small subunit [Candidatus Margulisbacteria bacterium GWF2_35_9]|nr:MAG: carbamoyl phosphate synthase small subunit [Candidatus Margulisbacteria bacterium GWF2_35_9]
MNKQNSAVLLLEDGRKFVGRSFGYHGEVLGEVVFNTSMSGYQEILTDPSYKYQIVNMTYPMIGNYGVNSDDVESEKVQVSGFVVKEYSKVYSNYRATGNLGDYLEKHKVCGIEGIDTRALTKHIRDRGAMRGIISSIDLDQDSLLKKVLASPQMNGMDLVKDVSCKSAYSFEEKSNISLLAYDTVSERAKFNVVVYDYGVKRNILRKLNDRGCHLTIVPANTSYKDVIEKYKPDGVFLSNGPGDPAAVTYAIENIKGLLEENIPLFGICLGHQLLGIASGAKTYKLKFGHRGGNQPVKNLKTDRVEITSQNHGFCVDMKTAKDNIEVTHVNLNDHTMEGIRHKEKPAFSVQYHPESAPGPHDSDYLFDEFIKLIKANK